MQRKFLTAILLLLLVVVLLQCTSGKGYLLLFTISIVCAFHLAGTMTAAWIEAKVLQSFDNGCFTSFNNLSDGTLLDQTLLVFLGVAPNTN